MSSEEHSNVAAPRAYAATQDELCPGPVRGLTQTYLTYVAGWRMVAVSFRCGVRAVRHGQSRELVRDWWQNLSCSKAPVPPALDYHFGELDAGHFNEQTSPMARICKIMYLSRLSVHILGT